MGQSGLGNSFRAYGRGGRSAEDGERGKRGQTRGDSAAGQGSTDGTTVTENTDAVLETLENVDVAERTVRYLYPAYFEVDAEAQIPLFEDETGITVVDEQTPAHATGTRRVYADLFEDGRPPFDVGHMDVIWPAKFAATGWSSPIADRAGHTDEMVETQVETVTVDGELQAMPIHADANVLYYRRDKLEEHGYTDPPATDGELVAIAQDILERDEDIEYGFVWQGGQNEGFMRRRLDRLNTWNVSGSPFRDST